MQVTIGIKHSARELQFETSTNHADLVAALDGCEERSVTLSDDKGRQFFLPAGTVAFVELGEAEPRRVGFAF